MTTLDHCHGFVDVFMGDAEFTETVGKGPSAQRITRHRCPKPECNDDSQHISYSRCVNVGT